MTFVILFSISLFSAFGGIGIASDWDFINRHRTNPRFQFLNRKPFSCAGCMAFWLCLGGVGAFWWGVGVNPAFFLAIPITTYYFTKQLDEYTNPFK